ncbi:MAG: molybdopterin-dependent oxidoreductase, partial [Firmicutes bacterium]|nr:molybdopterin-dependent oxidoreductase [Bacillota bacterium]
AERKADFREFNLGLTREAALAETKRCMSCGCQDAVDCELRRLCGEYDVDIKELGTHEKRYDIVHNDYLVQDENKCILCGNCVRICQEVQDNGVMGFVNRGFDTTVKPSMGLALSESQCESCGLCISACPTGALTAAQPCAKPGPFKAEKVVATTCTRCSTGCELEVHVSRDQIVSVTTPLRGGRNDGVLCHKGYFAAHYVHSRDRLTEPLVRAGDVLQATSWEKAVSAAASMLEHAKKLQGAGGLAVLVSPGLTNEENYLLQKLAREVLETNNIAGIGAADACAPAAAVSYSDLAASDFILVAGTDLTAEFSVLASMVRKAAEAGGKLAIVSEQPTRLDKYATHSLLVNTGYTADVLAALYGLAAEQGLVAEGAEMPCCAEDMRRLLDELPRLLRVGTAGLAAMLQDLAAAKRPVVIVTGDSVGCEEQELLAGLLAACGKKDDLLVMYAGGNTHGLLAMGVHPDLLPGFRPVSAVAAAPQHAGFALPDLLVKIGRGDIGAVLVAGDDLELDDSVFGPDTLVIALATAWRKDLARSDVVLPLATFAETDGTVINSQGRLLPVRAAVTPLAGRSNLEIIAALAAALGKQFPGSAAEVLAEVQAATGLDFAPAEGEAAS